MKSLYILSSWIIYKSLLDHLSSLKLLVLSRILRFDSLLLYHSRYCSHAAYLTAHRVSQKGIDKNFHSQLTVLEHIWRQSYSSFFFLRPMCFSSMKIQYKTAMNIRNTFVSYCFGNSLMTRTII